MSPIEVSEFDERTAFSKLRVTVTLELFSGLPPPTWVLRNQDAEAVVSSLKRLSRTEQQGPEPPGLGYRGVLLRIEEQRSVKEYMVYGGVVARNGEHLVDAGRSLERFVIESGRHVLAGDLLGEILEEF